MPLFSKNKIDYLSVQISSPEKVIWIGKAVSVSSKNSQGKFDILPRHANFMSIIKNEPIIIEAKGGTKKEYKFNRAIIYNYSNKTSIYAEV